MRLKIYKSNRVRFLHFDLDFNFIFVNRLKYSYYIRKYYGLNLSKVYLIKVRLYKGNQ